MDNFAEKTDAVQNFN